MKKMLVAAVGCLITVLLLFFTVDPDKAPSFVLVFPFILLFAILFMGFTYFLRKQGLDRHKSIKVSALCASMPMLLLVLQSIGQLTVRDVLTVMIIFFVSYFYIHRSTVSS